MASTFTRRQALAGSCMGAALFLAPGVAHASVTRFAVVSIANETQVNLLLSYRWGDSETWHQINSGRQGLGLTPYRTRTAPYSTSGSIRIRRAGDMSSPGSSPDVPRRSRTSISATNMLSATTARPRGSSRSSIYPADSASASTTPSPVKSPSPPRRACEGADADREGTPLIRQRAAICDIVPPPWLSTTACALSCRGFSASP